MPLVQAKCTNCGANLEVDNTKDAAVCPNCGTPFIVEKAINNYNTTNNIHADVVNVYGGDGADFVIRAGVLVEYNGAATDVVIPNSVKTIKDVFSFCTSLTSVTIPNSVTSIGWRAFSGCSGLTSVTIPNSVTSIGDSAFECCSSLTSVSIGNGVTSIGDSAFERCSSLTSVTIPEGVTKIGEHAFEHCNSLVSVTIPESVTKIGDEAFKYCSSLTSVTIPESVTEIGVYAFGGCSSLTNVNLPETWRLSEARERGLFSGTPYLDLKYNNNNNKYKGGCYIATAVYGSYDCPQVWTLRRFRDERLARHLFGRAFIRCYYAISPRLVKLFGETKWFQSFWKQHLDKLVHRLKDEGVADTPYCDKQW